MLSAIAERSIKNPRQIFGPNLSFWVTAKQGVFSDAGTTPAAQSAAVQQWNDLSGNGNNLSQGTAGNRPVFLSTGLNNRPAVSFTAASIHYISTANQVVPSAASTISAFAVAQMVSGIPTFGRLISWTTGNIVTVSDFNNTAAAALILRNNNTSDIYTFFNSSGLTNTSISLSTSYRFGMVYDGTNVTPYLNNVAGTAAAATPAFNSAGAVRLGGQWNNGSEPNAVWQGPMSEIVLTKHAATPMERKQLDLYFKAQWGL